MGGLYGGQSGAVWYCPTLIIGGRSLNDAGRITYEGYHFGTSAAPPRVLATITTFDRHPEGSYFLEDLSESSSVLDQRVSATILGRPKT